MVSWKQSLGRRAAMAAALCLLAQPFAVQARPVPQEGGEPRVDYALARREIQNFEAVLNNLLHSMFRNPFALVQKPKGAYLRGYGMTFHFLVNIHSAVIATPFGEIRRDGQITPDQKKKRIEEAKERIMRLLVEYGESLRQLRRDDSVTIVAFFEDRNFPDEENQNKTIVISASKRDLDELARREDRWKEFKQRMKVVEY